MFARVRIALAVASVVGGLMTVVGSPAHAAAATIHVPGDRPTIQAGIDAASNGDTVVVAPGTYLEHIDFKGKAIEVRSAGGTQPTIIDGGGTATVVTFKSGEGRTSVLRGFTITHGLVDGSTGVLSGAGIGIDGSSPLVTENLITGNDADGHAGGAIGVVGGAPFIYDNYILENTTGQVGGGGGVFLLNSAAEMERNVVEGNTAGGGGGVVAMGGTPVVRGNFIVGNRARFHGGGLVIAENGPGGVFMNNVMLDNTAALAGGGVHVEGSSPPYLLNNTIVNNQASAGTGVNIHSSTVTMTNNIVHGPAAQSLVRCAPGLGTSPLFSHNVVHNGAPSPFEGCPNPTGTNGNLSVDPLVVAPDTRNYYPQPGSPAIDAGTNDAPLLPAVDDFGDPRVTDGNGDGVAVVDMGAVELPPVPVRGVRYHPVTPARILDTRSGPPLGPASTLSLQVTGQGGVPASGVSAVVLNVTVTQPTSSSWLTAWPAGVARPNASNLNFVAGQTVPNLVAVKVGDEGKVDLFNSAGTTHVVADVAGWYGSSSEGSRYFGLTPARILDTRASAKVGPAATLALQVTGQGGVPATGVSAVVLNVTVTEPTADGWLTAWPAGVARPTASNLNFVAGQTVPNLVVVKVGEGGRVNLYNNTGSAHVIADVAGWYGPDGGPGGAGFSAATPARILDTRAGLGAPAAKVAPASGISLQVTGQGGVPASGVKSVVLNVTVTEPTAPSWLTAWPAGKPRPLASNLNYVAGQTVPNLVVVDVGTDGKVHLYNAAGATHVVADVAGWFTA